MKALYFYVLFFITFSTSANPGCLTNRGGFNNTKRVSIHPVICYCPCDRYPHDPRRDTCVRCGHAHADPGFTMARSIPVKEPWELLDME